MADETTPAEETAPKKAPARKAAAPKADAATKATSAAKSGTAAKATTSAKSTRQSAEAGTTDAPSVAASKSEGSKSADSKEPKASKSATATEKDAVKREQVLKVHHLRPAAGAKKDRTRVGRGEGSKGKTAGRGTKGTKARYQVRPGFQGGQLPLHMRAPKLRGFKNPFRVEYQVVNLERLAELYPAGGEVTTSDLVAKGAVRKNEKVKVLGNGDIAVKLNVAVDKVSGSAEQKILAAGGSVK
jgi:large subunit ribosomal protein L15